MTKRQRLRALLFTGLALLVEVSYTMQPRYQTWHAWTVYVWPLIATIFEVLWEKAHGIIQRSFDTNSQLLKINKELLDINAGYERQITRMLDLEKIDGD